MPDDDPGDVPERVRRARISDPRTGVAIREPTVERAEWPEPLVPGPKPARDPEPVSGWRGVDPIRRLASRSSLVTDAHLAAVERYRDLYEHGFGGGGMRGRDVIVTITRGRGATPSPPADARLAAVARWRAARDFAGGRFPDLLDHVALQLGDVSSWARRTGIDRKIAMGMLVVTLDRLAEYFDLPARPRR